MLASIARRWWILLVRGLLAIVLGIIAIVWPGITLYALVLVFATFTILDGIACIALGIRGEPDGTYWWTMIILGVLAIAAGIIAAAWPQITVFILVGIIAASAIIRGAIEIVAAIRLRQVLDDEWVLVLSGVLAITFGVLMLIRPDAGALVIVLLIGAYMLAIGILYVALALRLRKLQYALPRA